MKPLVLVVENDRGTRKLLEVLLSRFGLAVDLVPTGSDALLLLEHVEYELLFIDLMLAATTGMDVLASIAANRPAMLARAVVLSSAAPVQLERVREKWPAVRTIRKPFELTEIVELAQAAASSPPRAEASIIEQFTRRSVAVGAKAGVITRLAGDKLMPILWYGYPAGTIEPYAPIAVASPMPICAAVRKAEPVWIASVAAADHGYPQLLPVWEQLGSRAVAAVPIMKDGVVIGATGWSFREPRLFHEPEQQAFVAIADSISGRLA